MITRDDPGSNEQALDSTELKNSQQELIQKLQVQLEQMRVDNLLQKGTINRLQSRVTVLEDEVDDCEKDFFELNDANLNLKKQIQTLIEKNTSLTNVNEKLIAHYQASANSYNLPRRISFLTRSDSEDKPEANIPTVANLTL